MILLPKLFSFTENSLVLSAGNVKYVDSDSITLVASKNTLVITNMAEDQIIVDVRCNECTKNDQALIEVNQSIIINIDSFNFENITLLNYETGVILGIIK